MFGRVSTLEVLVCIRNANVKEKDFKIKFINQITDQNILKSFEMEWKSELSFSCQISLTSGLVGAGGWRWAVGALTRLITADVFNRGNAEIHVRLEDVLSCPEAETSQRFCPHDCQLWLKASPGPDWYRTFYMWIDSFQIPLKGLVVQKTGGCSNTMNVGFSRLCFFNY